MVRDEYQAQKRINRITQANQTHTYSLFCLESIVEKMILDRQHCRTFVLKLALERKDMAAATLFEGQEMKESRN